MEGRGTWNDTVCACHIVRVTISPYVCRHGLYRSDQLIYNDTDLSFKKTVPQTALFDPTTNQGNHHNSIITVFVIHDIVYIYMYMYIQPEYCHSFACVFPPVAFPEEDESCSDDEEEGPKLRSSIPSGSNPVPLGWPKVRNEVEIH